MQPALLAAILGLALLAAGKKTPKGHLEPLGGHVEPVPLAETAVMPSAQEFFEKHVAAFKPIVLRGASRGAPGMALWTSEYLREVRHWPNSLRLFLF